MIVREGHKISRICALYLYCRAPPQGDDKMSNRSSGTPCAHIDDQCNTVEKKERTKKKREKRTNCKTNERTCLFGPIKEKNGNDWLNGKKKA